MRNNIEPKWQHHSEIGMKKFNINFSLLLQEKTTGGNEVPLLRLFAMEFLDRITAFIPVARRHRWHYHGAFALNASYRKKVIAYAKGKSFKSSLIQQTVEKTKRASLDWAQLIKRIYEIDPLLCTQCGKKIKIIGFVTHQVFLSCSSQYFSKTSIKTIFKRIFRKVRSRKVKKSRFLDGSI